MTEGNPIVSLWRCGWSPRRKRFTYARQGVQLESSAEVILSTLLLEEVEFLQGLQSVDREYEVGVLSHAEASHGILQLDVVEDDGCDVVSILLSEGFIWSRLCLNINFIIFGKKFFHIINSINLQNN